jgi:hypothetical protein
MKPEKDAQEQELMCISLNIAALNLSLQQLEHHLQRKRSFEYSKTLVNQVSQLHGLQRQLVYLL